MTPSVPSESPNHPGTPGGAERRRHPRAALDLPITISLPDGDHEARLRDISRAGVCFFLDRRIPEMTLLRMDLCLPAQSADDEDQRVTGAGVVVRCLPLSPHVDHYEVAVFLNDMSEASRRGLEDYVAARA